MAGQIEIAERAGVSQSVVSRILSGKAKQFGIAEETIFRVQRIAEAVRYRPNPAAQMLLGKQTRLIGVVVPTFQDPFLSLVLESLKEATRSEGLSILVTDLGNRDRHKEDLLLLESYQPDAYFVVGTLDFENWPTTILNSGKTIIQLGDPSRRKEIVTCSINNKVGSEFLFEHLRKTNYSRVGLVTDSHDPNQKRLGCFQRHGRSKLSGIQVAWTYSSTKPGFAAGLEAAEAFLKGKMRHAQVLTAMDDTIALGLYRGLLAHGKLVPDDIAITGFDGIPASEMVWPGLTTVRQPVREMVRYGVDVILDRAPRSSRLFEPELLVRGSTAD